LSKARKRKRENDQADTKFPVFLKKREQGKERDGGGGKTRMEDSQKKEARDSRKIGTEAGRRRGN